MRPESVTLLKGSQEEDRIHWSALCRQAPQSDVYFLPEYSEIFSRNGSGESFCFVLESSDGMVLYPFLLRRINDLAEFRDLDECWDIATPYGYGGPLFYPEETDLQRPLSLSFLERFHEFCREHQIVSEFSRLHPFLRNDRLLPESDLVQHSDTVLIDLTQSPEMMWSGIRKGHKSSIKKGRRLGVGVLLDERLEYLDQFTELYTETMTRHGAAARYFYPKRFFQDTLALLNDNAFLFIALHSGDVATAAIFLQHGEYLHYHFSASNVDLQQTCANHVLIYEVAQWGKSRGAKTMHLGGGLADSSSLFTFKSGFSSGRAPFSTYRKIHDQAMYKELTRLTNGAEGEPSEHPVNEGVDGFFPAYRAERLSSDLRKDGVEPG